VSNSSESSASTVSTPDSTTSDSTTADGTTATTTAPSTVKWLLPLPKSGAKKQLNKFGNVMVAPGQSLGITWRSNDKIALVFVVDSLQVDRGCELQVKPLNGHFLVITVRVQIGYATGDDLENESIGFTEQFWTAFDTKDTAQVDTSSTAASACVTSKTGIPYAGDLEPGKVYTGKIVLDVAAAKGTAVLMNSLDGGWVYNYG
jgi:hypothetical protein